MTFNYLRHKQYSINFDTQYTAESTRVSIFRSTNIMVNICGLYQCQAFLSCNGCCNISHSTLSRYCSISRIVVLIVTINCCVKPLGQLKVNFWSSVTCLVGLTLFSLVFSKYIFVPGWVELIFIVLCNERQNELSSMVINYSARLLTCNGSDGTVYLIP